MENSDSSSLVDMDKFTFSQFKDTMDPYFKEFEKDKAQERQQIDLRLNEIRAKISEFDFPREGNASAIDDVSYAMFAQFKEFLSGRVEKLHQQIHESSETNARLAHDYFRVSQESSQILHQRVSEYEFQKAVEAREHEAWELQFDQNIADLRISLLYKDNPGINQFTEPHPDTKELTCWADVRDDLLVLKFLPSTRRYVLELLGISISDVESTFEDRYQLHPSVLQNSSREIPSEIMRAIDVRSNINYLQHPFWTENVGLRDEIDFECSKVIDGWLNASEDRPYLVEETKQKVDDITQLFCKMFG